MSSSAKTVASLLADLGPALRAAASITADSRAVHAGSVFVAVKGSTADGHRYIPQVLQAKPLLIVGEEPAENYPQAPYVRVDDSRLALAWLADAFHGHPSRSMRMVAVTGTSGKTTTTYLIESILRASGLRVGVIGTVNFRYEGQVLPSTHTTPGPVELQALLADMHNRGCQAVVMEVSSHALDQRRTATVAWDAAVFTNLSPEHLDYHPDLESYFQAKRLLFTDGLLDGLDGGKKPVAALHVGDAHGRRLFDELKGGHGFHNAVSFGRGGDEDFSGKTWTSGLGGIRGMVGGVEIRSPLVGTFNVENILGAVAVTSAMGIDGEAVVRGVADLKCVPGRLEAVEAGSSGVHVLVDYAHKPDALAQVLKTLRGLVPAGGTARLITVFGCGGDRDRTKRPVMGKLAAELSDRVWVTSDNPRTEDPLAILSEIETGMAGFTNWKREPDRARAIAGALAEAKRGDVVLIAGKGHETYQLLKDPHDPKKTLKIDFDDRDVARQVLVTKT
ncbi:MAG TPA: UDP-N-acetylmuramoyl-L-alanyl-D-glutamate--2,6-diaminopimelate ligase [Bdellovibrionota bacterium]|nr:UDP-N-acetylmuramoyl-L-alanyl-D-glutamate--2,6-diaminopimelate ligase [Bdellovibrionota bacterium]